MSTRRRLLRQAVELGPALLVSLLLLPLIISQGHLLPYQPNTIDLRVYHLAVEDLVNGRDIYLTSTPDDHLKFIYPPVAAVLMTPLLVGPYLLWQLLWTLLGTWALVVVLRRCRVPRGWLLGALAAVLVLAMEPIRTTVGYGQVNTMLMALVVADLLPDAPGEQRRVPQGSLIGLAAAIKLTPLLFLVFAVLVRKYPAAVVGLVSFLVFTGIGFLLLPAESMHFWRGLGQGEVNTAGPVYVGNQGMSGVLTRWLAEDRPTVIAALLLGFLVAGLATLVAASWWRRGEQVFAVGLVGLATCLASPLSWTHHHVWAVVLLVAVSLPGCRVPAWAQWTARVWMVWIALCLPLAVLPYGGRVELGYSVSQNIVGSLGPVLGSGLVLALTGELVRYLRRGKVHSAVTAA